MEIIRGIENLRHSEACAATVGSFDGLHKGHIKIIDRLKNIADDNNLCSALVTFDPHPKLVVGKQGNVRLLTTIDEKISILEDTGINKLIIIHFDHAFSQMRYDTFIKQVLVDKIGARAIVIGYDHAFGRDREGNYESMEVLSQKHNFLLEEVSPFRMGGQVVSSTLLRRIISSGDVDQAAKYLNRYYELTGVVKKGHARGKNLNFPTANLQTLNPHKLIPANGVYAVDVGFENTTYKGMLNIGMTPTFSNEKNFSIEVHIIDFDADIYNKELTVFFKKRLRDEIKFDSVEDLVTQLELDKQESMKL